MAKSKKLINTLTDIMTVDYISEYIKAGEELKFRIITKVKAGWFSSHYAQTSDPAQLLNRYKKGALQTIELVTGEDGFGATIFARKGKRVYLVDETLLKSLEVGDINQLFYNTNLYSQQQYTAVNAKTWADKAFIKN